jgi:hypothetical protein
MKIVKADKAFWNLKGQFDRSGEEVRRLEEMLETMQKNDPKRAVIQEKFMKAYEKMVVTLGRLHNYKPSRKAG